MIHDFGGLVLPFATRAQRGTLWQMIERLERASASGPESLQKLARIVLSYFLAPSELVARSDGGTPPEARIWERPVVLAGKAVHKMHTAWDRGGS